MERIYTSSARFDTPRALTEDEIRKIAPSVFATTAHESRSARFAPIPTIEVLRDLKNEGFSVVGVKQSISRRPNGADFAKHLLRLRRLDDAVKHTVNSTVLELLMKNANDGSSVWDFLAGLFRIQCLNSMACLTETIDHIKVRHTGDARAKVIDASFRVVGQAEKLLAAPAEWSQLKLERDERIAFAEAAHTIRFADAEGKTTTPITPEQLLRVRRTEDHGTDLWTTYNVLQENAVRGGVHGVGVNANGQRRRTTTRQITGIEQDVKVNQRLFKVANAIAAALGKGV